MNNKIIFLIIILGMLLGLIYKINQNQTERKKEQIEDKIRSDRNKFVLDSIESSKITNLIQVEQPNQNHSPTHFISSEKDEDYSTFINNSSENSGNSTDIAVTVYDEQGSINTNLSNDIANIYDHSGYSGNSGLIRSSFLQKAEFKDLCEGNYNIIDKLKLIKYTDYLALGKVSYDFSEGSLVNGTTICTVTISMNIISSLNKTIEKSFTFSVMANGVSQSQAKEFSTQKLLNKYHTEHSSL